jgi:hypothetical protein
MSNALPRQGHRHRIAAPLLQLASDAGPHRIVEPQATQKHDLFCRHGINLEAIPDVLIPVSSPLCEPVRALPPGRCARSRSFRHVPA